MPPGYEPLHLPPDPPSPKGWLARLESFVRVWNPEFDASLIAQLQVRDAIPPEVWGPNPDRQRLAAAMGKVIAGYTQWPNGHFIPEDPFRLALLVFPDGYDRGETEILMAIESLVGYDLDGIIPSLSEMTFGEVVDALLERTPTRMM